MSRRIRWTRRALARLDHVGAYIAEHDADAARRVVLRISTAATFLAEHPLIGRTGRVPNTREMVLADIPYIIVYRASEHEIEILTVMHTSLKWPKTF